ncbi:uncharacterized protein LOC135334631 [Halichondria panicea]|uniref:uncharacterized protein LOC135334631 n=1 Tax=Halichondria panicea TaxID=6063 RepID=UPI00312B458E
MPTKATKKGGNRRDNFSAAVVKILHKRVGGKCCRCDATTFGPVANNPIKSINIGQAAHIAAAAPGGPRYDPTMTPEERAGVTNGMWMCSNCHDIIDRDVDEYPTAKLRAMRKKAEQRAKAEMGVGTSKGVSETTDGVAVGVSAATIVDIRKAKAEIRALNGDKLSESRAEELLESVSFIDPAVDSYLPVVARELIAFYEQLVMHCQQPYVLLEVVRRLWILADAYHTQWTKQDVEAITRVSERVMKSVANERNRIYQSLVALLKDLSTYKILASTQALLVLFFITIDVLMI